MNVDSGVDAYFFRGVKSDCNGYVHYKIDMGYLELL